VTADGSILTANDKLNTDLFWAVRGGGCNFGVVTEFVYQLHPQSRNVYAGNLIFPTSVLDKLVHVTTEWWNDGNGPNEKEAMLLVLTKGPDRAVRVYSMYIYKRFTKSATINLIYLVLHCCNYFL
jgi:FAD/FMN-containing dehydrogenase